MTEFGDDTWEDTVLIEPAKETEDVLPTNIILINSLFKKYF